MKTARFTVEKARAKDVEQIRSVDKLVFQHAHGRRSLVNAVANGECWVAKTGSTILGYATLWHILARTWLLTRDRSPSGSST